MRRHLNPDTGRGFTTSVNLAGKLTRGTNDGISNFRTGKDDLDLVLRGKARRGVWPCYLGNLVFGNGWEFQKLVKEGPQFPPKLWSGRSSDGPDP